MKKMVIVRGSLIDSIEEYVLRECLRIMFPECEVEIRSVPIVDSQKMQMNIRPDQG